VASYTAVQTSYADVGPLYAAARLPTQTLGGGAHHALAPPL